MTDQFREQLDAFEKAYMKNLSIIISKMNKRCVLDHILELDYKIGHRMNKSYKNALNKSYKSEFRDAFVNGRINHCLRNINDAVMTESSKRIIKDEEENTGYYIDLILGKVEYKSDCEESEDSDNDSFDLFNEDKFDN